jgi:MFS family permease
MRSNAAPFGGQIDWRHTFACLRYPNFRLWFYGQMVSLFGTWMQMTAQGFLVFQLTKSPAYLGYVAFASGVPTWLLMLYGGVLSDRVPRRALLIATQTAMMVLAFILAAMTFLKVIQPWHIVALAFLLGIANAFDAPARQAFVTEMVDREDLTNAIALNGTMFNTATALGPAAAGLAYAALGPAWCFTLNGFSFIAVIVGLALMRLKPVVRRARNTSALVDLHEGLHYVVSNPVILTLTIMVGALSLFGNSFATLLPAWAVEILHGGAATNGWLQAARGLGALMCALLIAALGRFRFKGRLLTWGSMALAISLLAFSLVHWLPLSLLALVAVGATFMAVSNLANTLVQTQVDDELRGRVMGVYSLIFFGFMPIGSLLAGELTERSSAPLTVAGSALAWLACAAIVYVVVPRVRYLP